MSEAWEARESGSKGDLAIYQVGDPASSGRIATIPYREGWKARQIARAARIAAVPVMETAINAAIIAMTLGGFGMHHPIVMQLINARKSARGEA